MRALPPAAKILALLGFVVIVVATPTGAWTAYGMDTLLLIAVATYADVPRRAIVRAALIETPFLVFAAAMPLVASGERIAVGPLQLSLPGLIGGATLAIRAALGVLAAVILAHTTPARDLLVGLERLHLPAPLVAIASFMIRYAAVLTSDVERMRIARVSRGASGNRLAHLRAVAGSAGVLFVRSFERGERVQVAMMARGYDGALPRFDLFPQAPRTNPWWAAVLPGAAAVVLVTTLLAGVSRG